MKKGFKTAVALLTAVTAVFTFVAATACGHIHAWGNWHRNGTEHWRTCKECGEEERGAHTGDPCEICGYGFRALAFGFTTSNNGEDPAHADFAREAEGWFTQKGEELGFHYEQTTDWSLCNEENLKNYDLVMFLNAPPNTDEQRSAFRNYVENGGAFMAFHAAGFAMWSEPDHEPPTEWADWYHNTLLRSGEYGRCVDPDNPSITYWNTWNPTSEPLKIETHDHFCTEDIEGDEIISAPCEWYAWANKLTEDPSVTILLTLNPTEENPAGDDPRAGMEFQIWKTGHHPIAWANNDYKAVYMNWGHNLQSYNSFEKESSTFSSAKQNQFMLNAMFGLVSKN